MGLPTYPAPIDGLMPLILVCIIMSICIVRDLILFTGHLVGIRVWLWEEEDDSVHQYPSEWHEWRGCPSEAYMRAVQGQMQSVVCGPEQADHECPVCLTAFEPNTEINGLCCGHVFHKKCLETWFKYWKVTCPVCRSMVVSPPDDGTGFEAFGITF